MYLANKRINGQPVPTDKAVQIPKHIIQSLQVEKHVFGGYQSWYCYDGDGDLHLYLKVLTDTKHKTDTDYNFNITARKINTAVFSTSNRKERERKTATDKKMEKKRISRRIRYYIC